MNPSTARSMMNCLIGAVYKATMFHVIPAELVGCLSTKVTNRLTAKLTNCLTAKLVNRLTAKLVNCLTAKIMNHLTAKLVDWLTTKLVDHLTAKLVVVNLVTLHLAQIEENDTTS